VLSRYSSHAPYGSGMANGEALLGNERRSSNQQVIGSTPVRGSEI
jgi:hypothetical protein